MGSHIILESQPHPFPFPFFILMGLLTLEVFSQRPPLGLSSMASRLFCLRDPLGFHVRLWDAWMGVDSDTVTTLVPWWALHSVRSGFLPSSWVPLGSLLRWPLWFQLLLLLEFLEELSYRMVHWDAEGDSHSVERCLLLFFSYRHHHEMTCEVVI